MPFVEVLGPKDSLSPAQRERLAEELTRVALDAEGLPDGPAGRKLVLLAFREHDAVFVGGKPDAKPRFQVLLHVAHGGVTPERKGEVHPHVRDAFQRACPEVVVHGGANVWSIVDELGEGAFGAMGAAVSIETVRAMVTRG